mgnify:FL=1
MKEKLKYSLVAISICYSTVILLLMFVSFSNSTNNLKLSDNKENLAQLKVLKNDLSTVKNKSCVNSINGLIEYYEKTSYTGEVNLKERFNSYDSSLNYIEPIKKNCNINNEQIKNNNLDIELLTSSTQLDEELIKYYFQYEMKLPDEFNRTIIEPEMTNMHYRINRKLLLESISKFIDLSKEGEV